MTTCTLIYPFPSRPRLILPGGKATKPSTSGFVEHWYVLQGEIHAELTKSGNPMFSEA